jgi:hypothetical protein
MKCIYFGKECEANPTSYGRFNYTPTDEEKKNLCNSGAFRTCPRYKAYLENLKANNQ